MQYSSIPIIYQSFESPLSHEAIVLMTEVNQVLFPFNESVEILSSFFIQKTKAFICIALKEQRAIGFKAGFQLQPGVFESWRGGVLESERRLGVASHLMRLQHHWCISHGFHMIKTTTNDDNKAMLNLNLQHGFKVVSTFLNPQNRLKIVQEKKLLTEDRELK